MFSKSYFTFHALKPTKYYLEGLQLHMFWYLIYNILKIFAPNMENQHRNLTTFLCGIVIYTLIYSYMGSYVRDSDNLFLRHFFQNFVYIMIADGFAMGVLYKNYYNRTIFSEVKETFGDLYKDTIQHGLNTKLPSEPPQKQEKEQTQDVNKDKPPTNICLVGNDAYNEDDNMEGFAKDSALGDNWT